jgi:hypothetical protein
MMPNDINPIANSVIVHLFISCVYGLIDKVVPVFRYRARRLIELLWASIKVITKTE